MDSLLHAIDVRTDGRRGVRRRDFLRAVGAGATLGLADRLALAAPTLRGSGRRCVVLWMAGGPSQHETLDPKPSADGGVGAASIATSVPGVRLSENLPELARRMDDLAVVRSLTSREGSHPRAQHLMQHGYLPMGGVRFPTLGANLAERCGEQLSEAAAALPGYVRIGGGRAYSGGAGMLGIDHDPLVVRNAARPPENTRPARGDARLRRRRALLDRLGAGFGRVEGADLVTQKQRLLDASEAMIRSPGMAAFDLDQEPAATRAAYGEGRFAEGCLLARRLLEAGVTCVEVVQGGWDTHQDNHAKVAENCAAVDRPAARLLADLKERGLLDTTLVVWMGEFGRTPKINARGGRDHYPKAFSGWLAGGGVAGGQVLGATDARGAEVIERPVTPQDLHQTVYRLLGVDAHHENVSSAGRPIKLVDGGEPIAELIG